MDGFLKQPYNGLSHHPSRRAVRPREPQVVKVSLLQSTFRISGCLLALAGASVGNGAIRPSFRLSRCTWEATEVVELVAAPGEARFRVVNSIKGGIRIGATKYLPELAPPPQGQALLKQLVTFFPNEQPYLLAPPIRHTDHLIVFLQNRNQPANWDMLASTIWLQDSVGYVFKQTMNPGPTHLVPYSVEGLEINDGKPVWKPKPNEPRIREDISRQLQLRSSFDRAVANPNPTVRATNLARLVTSGDDVAVRGTLAKLKGEGPEAAHALRPYLDDDSLLAVHFDILDTIAVTGARNIRLDSIIRRETEYWAQTCRGTLGDSWAADYRAPPAFHYLRLVSALKAIRTLGIRDDFPVVREFSKVLRQCHQLNQKPELAKLTALLVEQQ